MIYTIDQTASSGERLRREAALADFSDYTTAEKAIADPSTNIQQLIDIARRHRMLLPGVALHPNASPELLDWLDSWGLPDLSTAVAQRRSGFTGAVPSESTPPTPTSTDTTDKPVRLGKNARKRRLRAAIVAAQETTAANRQADLAASTPDTESEIPDAVEEFFDDSDSVEWEDKPWMWEGEEETFMDRHRGWRIASNILKVVLVLAILGVGGFFLYRFVFGESEPGKAPDFTSEPRPRGNYSITKDLSQDYAGFYQIDAYQVPTGDLTLINVSVNYEGYLAGKTSPDWYEDYAVDYDRGLADGKTCFHAPAPEQFNSYGVETRAYFDWNTNRLTYCLYDAEPRIGSSASYGNDDAAGYRDGYQDGLANTPGSSKLAEPVLPDSEAAVLRGVDLDSGNISWTLDLSQATGMVRPLVSDIKLDASGMAAVLIRETASSAPDQRPTLLVVDLSDGQVPERTVLDQLADKQVYQLIGFTDKFAFLRAGTNLIALTTDGLDQAWTATCASAACQSSPGAPLIKNHLLSDAGYLADDGQPVFGTDISETVYYAVSDDAVFRYQLLPSEQTPAEPPADAEPTAPQWSVNRFDTSNNETAWSNPITVSAPVVAADDYIYAIDGSTISSYALDDAATRWTKDSPETPVTLEALRERVLVTTAAGEDKYNLYVFNAETGIVVRSLADEGMSTEVHHLLGAKMFYTYSLSKGTVNAYNTTREGFARAWDLQLPDAARLGILQDCFLYINDASGSIQVVS
jgi:hypothetical protein